MMHAFGIFSITFLLYALSSAEKMEKVTRAPVKSIRQPSVCGGVSPMTRWSRTDRRDTIRMSIDTSDCDFTDVPTYFTSISGSAGHYLLIGVDAIYEPTRSGFLINVHSSDNQTADTLMSWSALYNWSVNWFGVL